MAFCLALDTSARLTLSRAGSGGCGAPAREPSSQSAAQRRENWREAALVVALCAVVVLASLAFQPQIAVNGGQGWDGRFYYRIT
jgi:ferric-dicitrate binding protein FerR (iron transport regulator)